MGYRPARAAAPGSDGGAGEPGAGIHEQQGELELGAWVCPKDGGAG